jgi:hypothetical protein
VPAGGGGQCATTSGASGAYSVKICISAPDNGATLTSDSPVSARVTVTGTSPGVQHVAFYLNGTPLLEDFSAPYEFVLPTNQWADGSYTLSAEAYTRDGFTSDQASIPVTFQTGASSDAVNNNHFQPTSGNPAQPGQSFTVGVVGDGAGGEPGETRVVNMIASWNPNLFLYLGDVYERGTIAEFHNWYAPDTLYGRFRSITDPTVGNHEYILGTDNAYTAYWDNIPDYYSFDAGGWHFISLNSNRSKVPLGPDSAQYQWLQNDLAQDRSKCTAVYFHHPFVSIGKEGGTAALVDIWKLMAQYHVTLVLNGHDHEYQRWVPLDGNAQPSPDGMTEFIVGTGGHSLTPFVTSDNRVAASMQKVFGALRLQLNPTSADFSYMRADTGAVVDSGTVSCQGQ